jgi:hypothetical protein
MTLAHARGGAHAFRVAWRAATIICARGVVACLLVVLLGCRREKPTPTMTPVPPPPVSVSARASASASASPPPPTSKDDSDRARAIAAEWNAALNAKDDVSLRKLYGSDVRYYGQSLDGAACAKRAMDALAKSPGFHQEITITGFSWQQSIQPNRVTVSFAKRSNGKEYAAYLVLEQKTWRIVGESDLTTDTNLAKTTKCLTYGAVTLTGKLGHAVGASPDDEFWTLELDHPVCVVRGDFRDDRAPQRLDDVSMVQAFGTTLDAAKDSKKFSVTGDLLPNGRHGMDVYIDIKTLAP